jgi:hypothetical protein
VDNWTTFQDLQHWISIVKHWDAWKTVIGITLFGFFFSWDDSTGLSFEIEFGKR